MRFVDILYSLPSIIFVIVLITALEDVWKKWLTGNEVVLAVSLLAIPYFTRSFEMCMDAFGRFASIVFPVYIVVAQLLVRLPAWLATALLAVSGFFLGAFSALFSAWYPVV